MAPVYYDNKFEHLTQFLQRPFSSFFVLADNNTETHCLSLMADALPGYTLIAIAEGEGNKNLASCETIWNALTEANADRKALLINIGGGVISDLGGFAASCYKRGISFINVPTTLLAMVDASVGAKTGIDFGGFKNQVGTFANPEAVFINTGFLNTLPARELHSGFAEVIKHYLINDKRGFDELADNKPDLTTLSWQAIIERNVNVKKAIVLQDPKETGVRKALNFGHTLGHAIESVFIESNLPLLHGEAIAIGMLAESMISFEKGFISNTELNAIEDVIRHYFKLYYIKTAEFDKILMLLKQDKKNEYNNVLFTLLRGIGNYCINNIVEDGLILKSLNYYNNLINERN